MQSQKIEQQALRALISTLLLSVFFGYLSSLHKLHPPSSVILV